MSPFLEDGIGWNGMKCLSHQVTSQTKQCRKWPCGFCGPSLALPWLRHQGSSNSQKGVQSRSVCASQEGIQGRPGGGNQRQEGSGKKKIIIIKRVLRDTAWLPYLVTVKTVFCLLWRSGHNSALSGRVSIALFSTRW